MPLGAGLLGFVLISGASVPGDPILVVALPEVESIELCRTPSGTIPMLVRTRVRITNLTPKPVVVAHRAVGGELIRMQGRGQDATKPELRSARHQDQAVSRRFLDLPLDTAELGRDFRVISEKASAVIDGPTIALMLRAKPQHVVGLPPAAKVRLQISLSLWPFQPLSEGEWQSLRRDLREQGTLIDDESFLSDWFDLDVPPDPGAAQPCAADIAKRNRGASVGAAQRAGVG